VTRAADRRRVVVVFTGGTISMLVDPATGAAAPALDGAAILARTPGLDAIAQVEPVDWGLVPASHLRFDQLLDIARLLRDALARPDVAGAVVVQGTDSIEETAMAWDLLVPSPKPVVVVGAMRHAGDPGYEGPSNLRDAVRVAASGALDDQGTVVVMGSVILPAADVIKTDTDRSTAGPWGMSVVTRSPCGGGASAESRCRSSRSMPPSPWTW
jgi:L-asparaginase